jgi:hypothetical protein
MPPNGNVECSDWPNVRTRKAPCCGQPHELPSELEVTPVAPGMWSVCAHCYKPLLFNADLTQRVMTDQDFDALSTEEKRMVLVMMLDTRMDPWIRHRAAELREAAEARSDTRAPERPPPMMVWLRKPGLA